MGIFTPIVKFFTSIYIFLWDNLLAIGNLVFPKRPAGLIVPDGHPGFGGKWPEHTPAKEGDSRSSCPALNALANHGASSIIVIQISTDRLFHFIFCAGIIAHDGRDISFVDLAQQVQTTYNMAPTFCIFLSQYIANFMKKDYYKDTFDLKELDQHNKIEHDGSLIRTSAASDKCPPQKIIIINSSPTIRRRHLFRARHS